MTQLTVDQKRIIGLLLKEFCGEAPMEPLSNEVYDALLDAEL